MDEGLGGGRSGISILRGARLAFALVTAGVIVRRRSDTLRDESIEGDR